MKLTITNKDGVTLKTKGTYCAEDIVLSIDKDILGINTSDATATADKILEGYTAYINDEKVTGNIEEYDGSFDGEVIQGVYPEGNLEITNIEQVDVSAYATAQITDENLKAANLPKGMNILGIDGTNAMANFDTAFTVDESEKYLRVDTELTDYGIDKIILNGQSNLEVADVVNIAVDSVNGGSIVAENLSPENIKLNTTILGVTGTLQPKLDEDEAYATSLQARLDSSNSAAYLMYGDGRSDLSFLSNLDTSNVTDMRSMFSNCRNIITIPQLYTSSATNMNNMFSSCTSLTEVPQLDTSKVTDISNMFDGCSKLTTIHQLDTSKVTNMSCMFRNCSSLASIPQLDTSKVTSMYELFGYCKNLTTIPQLDTSKVTSMTYMFNGCYNLASIPQLNTFKVTSMTNMFNGCYKLEHIDLTHYNGTSSSSKMFSYCYSLKELIIRSFGDNYTISTNAFTGCYHLTGTVNSTYNPNGDKDCWIRVPDDMVDTLRSASGWSTYASQIIGFDEVQVLDDVIAHTEAQTKNMTIRLYRNTNAPTSVSITSNNETITTITNIVTSTDRITFDLNFTGTIGDSIISVNVEGDYSSSYIFNANFIDYTPPTYTVEAVEGATCGFTLNDNGYYESTNKNKNNSYSICKLTVNTMQDTTLLLDCISWAETNCDFGILSNLDTTLTLSSNTDSTNVYKSFQSLNSSAVKQVTYSIPSGEHFIYIKYRKDGSQHINNDSFQFKVSFATE